MSSPTTALAHREHRRLARLLHVQQVAGRIPQPLSAHYPELTAADAEQIRDELVLRRLAAGEALVGARVIEDAEGESRVAWLTDAMVVRDGGPREPHSSDALVAVDLVWPPSRAEPTAPELRSAIVVGRCATELAQRTGPIGIDLLATNLGVRAVRLGARLGRAKLEPQLEMLAWLARYCRGGTSRVGARTTEVARLTVVAAGTSPRSRE